LKEISQNSYGTKKNEPGNASILGEKRVWDGQKAGITTSPNPGSEKIIINLPQPRSIFQSQLVIIANKHRGRKKHSIFYRNKHFTFASGNVLYPYHS
jgi:hypothetical protein